VSADFFSIAIPHDRGDTLVSELAAAECEYNDNVYVDLRFDRYNSICVAAPEPGSDDEEIPPIISSNFPVFVALDRFVTGRKLLDGHAFRWLPPDRVPWFGQMFQRVVRFGGGRASVIDEVARWIDRGSGAREQAREGLDALEKAIGVAQKAGTGLLVLCVPC
jgi:hypothetical protein